MEKENEETLVSERKMGMKERRSRERPRAEEKEKRVHTSGGFKEARELTKIVILSSSSFFFTFDSFTFNFSTTISITLNQSHS